MITLSVDPTGSHEQQAAVAAHELREALGALGLLESVPQCRAAMDGDRPVVHLGDVDAAVACQLAGHFILAAMAQTTTEATQLTAEVALFSEHDSVSYVLLIQRGQPPHQDRWALPGGQVNAGEPVMAAACRKLTECTGLALKGPEQVGVYADPGRDPRGRYASVVYTARVPGLPTPTAGDNATCARWMPVEELLHGPDLLAFDHHQIMHDALYLRY